MAVFVIFRIVASVIYTDKNKKAFVGWCMINTV